MSIIVDTNSTHRLFNGDPAGGLVYKKIADGTLIYVTGGHHKTEVLNGGMKIEIFRQLLLAGRLRVYPDHQCAKDLVNHLPLESDDPHVISLAIRSGCRLLFSQDAALCRDFKKKNVIDKPRGKVYQSEKHARLLKPAKLSP